jgi:molybdopterin converting factor small subunit
VPTVELFAQARLLAGERSLQVAGSSVQQVLSNLATCCPKLIGTVLSEDGGLTPAYALNLNGTRFTTDPAEPLAPNDTLLILSSLSGG